MVEDLIIENAKAIFLLESPHTSEVENCGMLPLLGESGDVFSRTLLPNASVPAGRQEDIPYSLMNTFQHGLQVAAEMAQLNQAIQKINYQTQKQYKDSLKKVFLKNEPILNLLENYKSRLENAILKGNNKIVVCGLIAQSYFEYALNILNTKFLSEFQVNIFNKNVRIFYIWHPSPRSGEDGISAWEKPCNRQSINNLKNFLNA